MHQGGIALNTGRACLSLILQKIKPTKVYLPYYSCHALRVPLLDHNTPFVFYAIDEDLLPLYIPELNAGELIVLVNYFGLKDNEITRIIAEVKGQVVVDNTHAFFREGYSGGTLSFNSARKFFGVADGAFLYGLEVDIESLDRFGSENIEPNVLRLAGRQKEAYQAFVDYEETITSDVKRISVLSERLISLVDFESCARKRVGNFEYLHSILGSLNQLKIGDTVSGVPLCYPFVHSEPIDKTFFHKKGLFIPTFWQEVVTQGVEGYAFEKNFAQCLLPLPIDHRYGEQDMEVIGELVRSSIR